MPKISVIVPIYNVEKYLERSIQSLVNQSLKDIEIILVNDGSKDNGITICRKYESIDERIKVIDKSNGGVSSARNEGIKIATGDYIGFIDPDDWVESDMYAELYEHITTNNCDAAMCNFLIDDNSMMKEIKISTHKHVLDKQDIINWLIPNLIGPENLNSNTSAMMGSAWRVLVKRELILEKNILFPIQIPLMEDLIWCIEVFANISSVVIDNGVHYHYMKNDNTAVTAYRANLSSVQQEVFAKIKNLLIKYDIEKYCRERLNHRLIHMILFNIKNEINNDCPNTKKEKLNNINKWCEDEYVKNALNTLDIKHYTLRKKLILLAMKNGIGSYLYLYYNFLKR